MKDLFGAWYRRYFSDPQAIILLFSLVVLFGLLIVFGGMLLPVLASVVIAYLLEGIVAALQRLHVPRIVAVLIVFCAFLAFLVLILFALLPMMYQQATQFVQELPRLVGQGQAVLMQLPERYPHLFTAEQVQELTAAIRAEIGKLGQAVVSLSVSSLVGVITLVVYLVLVPLLVFFFLKDKDEILGWMARFLPRDRGLLVRVWNDVDAQIGNYVRGKFWEMMAVWAATYLVFGFMDMRYAMLVAVATGLSVLVPYIGVVVVAFPVAIVAYSQWGLGSEFAYAIGAYAVIQIIDGNVLAPLLISEVVNLHPVAVIVAILVFGGLWGFWGVFFAIPLATLVKAVLHAWPERLEPAPAQSTSEA